MEFVHGLTQTVRTAEQPDDFTNGTVLRYRRNVQYVGQNELLCPMFRILLKQLIEYRARLGRELLEKCLFLFLNAIGPLAAGRSGALKAR